jgi:Protein of unknown function (DUF4031)
MSTKTHKGSARVVVDRLRAWPQKTTGQAAQHFGDGRRSCHLMIDAQNIAEPATIELLHSFAQKIGLKREWFQPGKASAPHYDLTPTKRKTALLAGAVEISDLECADLVERYMASRGAI